jgi:NO-binding membrane sensor protein with MHYT domain
MAFTDGEVAHQHISAAHVVVSFVLAFMGAYSTVSLAEHHRISGFLKSKLISQPMYLVLMSISLGIGCIWSMHFVGMSGVEYTDSDDKVIHFEYDIIESMLSMASCVILIYVGLYISSRDKMFCRDKDEIFQLILAEGKHDSMESVRSKHYIMKVALFRGTGPLLLGGVIAGSGVCIMHYVGMLAIHAPLTVHWNVGVVSASVLIAIAAATAAFWILFRLLALYPAYESLRLLSSLVMAIAVCGMHYTGMMAASFSLNSSPPDAVFGSTMSKKTANIIAFALGMLCTWASSMVVQAELRTWHVYLRSRLKASRKILDELHTRYDNDQLLQDYEMKNEAVVSVFEVQRSNIGSGVLSKKSSGDADLSKVRPIDDEETNDMTGSDEMVRN